MFVGIWGSGIDEFIVERFGLEKLYGVMVFLGVWFGMYYVYRRFFFVSRMIEK